METPVVLPIKPADPDDLEGRIHPNLPQPPSLICIYASFRSGKSVLVNNMILSPLFLRGLLDRWYIFSPTAKNDDSCRFLLDEEGVEIIDEYSDEYLQAVLQYQMETPKEDRDAIGVVFDDAIQYLQSRFSIGNFLAVKFRHYNIKYLIYVSQSFKSLDTKIRANSKAVILMKIANEREIEKIEEEYTGFLGGKFRELYNYCLNDAPYSFMYINIDANPVEAWLRFEKKIYPPEAGSQTPTKQAEGGDIPADPLPKKKTRVSKKKKEQLESMSEIKNRHY